MFDEIQGYLILSAADWQVNWMNFELHKFRKTIWLHHRLFYVIMLFLVISDFSFYCNL